MRTSRGDLNGEGGGATAAPAEPVLTPDLTATAEVLPRGLDEPVHDQSACDLCVNARDTGYWGRSDVTHCRDCGRTWSRTARDAHCAGCHRHFSGTKAFDEHVKGSVPGKRSSETVHSDPPNDRYVLVQDHPTGPTWMSRLNPAFLSRMEALRAKE